MIKTSKQLKDLIRNLSKKNSDDAQILLRNYMMERFLERISLSKHKDRFILKGGMLVAAMVGLDARSTMDLDATVKGIKKSLRGKFDIVLSSCWRRDLLRYGLIIWKPCWLKSWKQSSAEALRTRG